MNTKDIDEIFKIMERKETDFYEDDNDEEFDFYDLWETMQKYRYNSLIKYSNMKTIDNKDLNIEDVSDQYYYKYDILYESIMNQIESNKELYDYFTSKRDNNRELYSYLLAYTKNHVKDIEKFLRECIYKDLSEENITNLIRATGNYKKFLFKGQGDIELYDGLTIGNVVKGLENIEEFLMSENAEKSKLVPYDFVNLIRETGNIKKYLKKEYIDKFKLKKGDIIALLKDLDDVYGVLTPEIASKYYFGDNEINMLVNKSKNIEKFKILKKDKKFNIANLINATGKIEEYLDSEDFNQYDITLNDIVKLIIKTNNIKKYLTPEYIKKFELDEDNISDLIYELPKEDIEKFLFESQKNKNRFFLLNIANVIKATENIEEYLSMENVIKYNLSSKMISELITEAKLEEKYKNDSQNKDQEKDTFSIETIINKSGRLDEYIKCKNEKIILPSNMTIGIEIETMGQASSFILENYKNLGVEGFESEWDPSLREDVFASSVEGVEVKTPILTGDFDKWSESIKRVCGKLNIMRSENK